MTPAEKRRQAKRDARRQAKREAMKPIESPFARPLHSLVRHLAHTEDKTEAQRVEEMLTKHAVAKAKRDAQLAVAKETEHEVTKT